MTSRPEWNLPTRTVDAVAFTRTVAAREEADEETFQNESDEPGYKEALQAGWIEKIPNTTARLGDPIDHAATTTRGRAYLDHVDLALKSRGKRFNACQQGLLLWLYDTETLNTEDFVNADYRFYGEPFTPDEIWEAAKNLRERDLIKGTLTWGHAILRPAITPAGLNVVEQHNGDIHAATTNEIGFHMNFTQNIHGGVTGSQIGQGTNITQNQQNNTGINADELAQIIQTMHNELGSIDNPDQRDDVRDMIDDLREAVLAGDRADAEKKAGKLQRLAQLVGTESLKAAVGVGVKAALALLPFIA